MAVTAAAGSSAARKRTAVAAWIRPGVAVLEDGGDVGEGHRGAAESPVGSATDGGEASSGCSGSTAAAARACAGGERRLGRRRKEGGRGRGPPF